MNKIYADSALLDFNLWLETAREKNLIDFDHAFGVTA